MLVALVVFGAVASRHRIGTYGVEGDFYEFFEPDSRRLAAGQFPEDPFRGPGYAAVLAAVVGLTGVSAFAAGKVISVASASLALLLTARLFASLFGGGVGLAAAALTATAPLFPSFAITASTDMLFLLAAVGSIAVLLEKRLSLKWRVAGSAILSGIAYLIRYNGFFLGGAALLGIAVLNIFDVDLRSRMKWCAVFLLVVFVVVSPWLWANWRHRGSLFYNENYLNVATRFFPELSGGSVTGDGLARIDGIFHSMGDVLRRDPPRLIRRYPVHVYETVRNSLTGDVVAPWVGVAALAGAAFLLWQRRPTAAFVPLAAAAFYVLVTSLTHWDPRYYLLLTVVYAGLAAYALSRLVGAARTRGLSPGLSRLVLVGILVLMTGGSIVVARSRLTRMLAGEPVELFAACDFLRNDGARAARIVARKPHLAAICGQEWVYFPPVESIEALRQWLLKNPADYVLFSGIERERRKELAALSEPRQAPSWLTPVWQSEKASLVLYRPSREIEN